MKAKLLKKVRRKVYIELDKLDGFYYVTTIWPALKNCGFKYLEHAVSYRRKEILRIIYRMQPNRRFKKLN